MKIYAITHVDRKCLRVTFCTHLAMNKVPFELAVKLMRHTDYNLTLRVYTRYRLLLNNLHDAIEKLVDDSDVNTTAA